MISGEIKLLGGCSPPSPLVDPPLRGANNVSDPYACRRSSVTLRGRGTSNLAEKRWLVVAGN
jgi:hypothetical protein